MKTLRDYIDIIRTNEGIASDLAKGAAAAVSHVAPAATRTAPAVAGNLAGWASKPAITSEISKMSPALQHEFLVRFPDYAATNKALDDIYSMAKDLHRSGNTAGAQSLLSAHNCLNMMSTSGPTDKLMLDFKAALKNQTP